MCGIGGIAWEATADALRGPLAAMEASMVHRGPDDGGLELLEVPAGGAVGLCARRLAIQDLSPRGHQPLPSSRSGSWACLNGEIYNAGELRAELTARGHRFRGSSDTEVVLAAFEAWGTSCFARLRGMFAVAVWDAPGRRLVLARDRLGIKPLYYQLARPSRLMFASEVGALLATGLVASSLSASGVASYLANGAVDEPGTLLTGVLALPPGHVGVWDGDQLHLTAYWSLARCFATSSRMARSDAVAAIRQGLEDSVRRHLVSDVPLGVFLSGGVDSSALVGLVAAVGQQAPQTVSVVFPQQQWSEEAFIRLVAERFGTRHTQVVLDDSEVLAQVPAALAAMDQPTFDGVNTYIVSGQARAAGLTVALSGVGGDELFAGYDTFRIVPRLERLRAVVRGPARQVAAAVARGATRDSDRGRKLARWLGAREPEISAVALRRELFAPAAVTDLLGDPGPGAGAAAAAALPVDVANRVSFLELDRYMRNVLLRDSDVLSMAHGLEVRVPFLDHELVELVAGLPGALKTAGSMPKPLLVEAVSDLLPSEVIARPKKGFALPFPVWLRGALRARVEAALLDRAYGGPVAGLLDQVAVTAVWRRFLEGRAEWVRPWALYVLKVWGEERLPALATPAGRPVP